MGDANKKVLGYVGSAIMCFAIAAFFEFVLNTWGDLVVGLCVISMLSFAWAPQRLDPYMNAGGRVFLLALAAVAAAAFGAVFLSWTMTAVYVGVNVAVALAAIAEG
jgi:hypothetical protein